MLAKRSVKRCPEFSLDDELFGIMQNGVERHTVAMVTTIWTKFIASETLVFL